MSLLNSASEDSDVEESVKSAIDEARENVEKAETPEVDDGEEPYDNPELVSELERLKAQVNSMARSQEEPDFKDSELPEDLEQRLEKLEEQVQETEIEERVTRSELENRIEEIELSDKVGQEELDRRLEELKSELQPEAFGELEQLNSRMENIEAKMEELEQQLQNTEIEEKVDRSELEQRIDELKSEEDREVEELRSQVEEVSELLLDVSRRL